MLVLAAKKPNGIPVCISQNTTTMSRDMSPSPLLSVGEAAFGVLCPVLHEMDMLERVQQKATKMMKGLEHL